MLGQFLNPYNFISLPAKKASAYSDADRHTGVIEYTITAKSPLFIPNTSNEDAFQCGVKDHKSYDFYSYTTLTEGKNHKNEYYEPVIPGSELRGMLRSVYETLTDSCMGVLNESTYPTMRIGEAYQAGLLKRLSGGGYELVTAEDCIYRKEKGTDAKGKPRYALLYKEEQLPEGAKVFFCRKKRYKEDFGKKRELKSLIREVSTVKDGEHKEEGYLIKGEADGSLGKKHNCHVFIPKEGTGTSLKSEDIDRLQAVLKAYREEPSAEKKYAEYQKELNVFLKGKGNDYFPVYFSKVGGKYLYLAPACFSKEAAVHSLKDLAGVWAPCEGGAVCPTCALFGMIGGKGTEYGGSKIRFADARVSLPEENASSDWAAYFDEIVTLEALGAPRLQNVEFYLERPDGAVFWNYDYYIMNGGAEVIPYKATLRGRKFYWHQRGKVLRTDVEKNNLNKTVRPVKSGITFTGKLFFDGISYKQLNQLLWILNGGNEAEQPETGHIAYKLGMGKPLGMGSVELKVTKLSERTIALEEDSISYAVKEENPEIVVYEAAEFSDAAKEDFFTIASLDAAQGKTVTYPIVEGQQDRAMTEGFKWFVENHSKYEGGKRKMAQKRGQLLRHYALPKISNAETLPRLLENDGNGVTSSGGNGGARPQGGGFGSKPKDAVTQIKIGDVLTCKLNGDAAPDRNGNGYVGFVMSGGSKGTIFGLRSPLKKGTEVKVKVNRVTDGKFFANYMG